MAVVNGYCTVAELRTWMSDTTSVLSETILENAISSTSRMIDAFCSRRFWRDPTPTTRMYQVTESDLAWVDDIATTSGLIIETDDLADGTFSTTWLSTDYDLSPYNTEVDIATAHAFTRIHGLARLFPVNDYRRTLRVTATFGWSAIPDQIHQACLMKSNVLALRRDSPYGVAGFSEFGVIRLGRTEDPEITRMLAPFMRSNVGAV
jgi:hypothetical protein